MVLVATSRTSSVPVQSSDPTLPDQDTPKDRVVPRFCHTPDVPLDIVPDKFVQRHS